MHPHISIGWSVNLPVCPRGTLCGKKEKKLIFSIQTFVSKVSIQKFVFKLSIQKYPVKSLHLMGSGGSLLNLVLNTIMMIKEVYGAKICVFVARLRGGTSGLSFSSNF